MFAFEGSNRCSDICCTGIGQEGGWLCPKCSSPQRWHAAQIGLTVVRLNSLRAVAEGRMQMGKREVEQLSTLLSATGVRLIKAYFVADYETWLQQLRTLRSQAEAHAT